MGDETKLSLKLLVDTKSNRVLYAEAGKEFIDFLLQIMLLPVGTITELVNTTQYTTGSLGNLYKSIETLNTDHYIQANTTMDKILKPTSSMIMGDFSPNFLLLKDNPEAKTTSRMFYGCSWSPHGHYQYVSDVPSAVCPSCQNVMDYKLNYVAPKGGGVGGYVRGSVTYMVMDNLEVKPMSTVSAITLINKFHVKEVASLVEKQVQVGFHEGIRILKALLKNQAVLTTAFLEDDCLP